MNPLGILFKAHRHVKQLNAHIRNVSLAQDDARRLLNSSAFEEFLDWLETDVSIRWLLISKFNHDRPYTRNDLKNIFADLRAGGLRAQDIMQTFASRSAFQYLARAIRLGEGYDAIVRTLKDHWERKQKLPALAAG